jgi:UDP-N-acetylglucosamine--N-acetylmuramyl-(pentapeptide) pyrophosphoryl-undecaprenol N-acetylglucosamine transferase
MTPIAVRARSVVHRAGRRSGRRSGPDRSAESRAGSARRGSFAVVAGGGTGGHVVPALAIARALVRHGHPARSIEIVGSRRGLDVAMLGAEGFPVTLLPGRGIARGRDIRSILRNAAAAAGLAGGTVEALVIIARRRPRVVVSVGGYVAFAPGVAAVVFGIPLVLVNVDAVPGLVHRVLGRRAAASAVAVTGTALPRAVVTGAPVRAELFDLDRSPEGIDGARSALGLPAGRTTLGVVGGSLGARRINDAVTALADRWRDRGDLSIYHVTGRRDWQLVASEQAEQLAAPVGDGLVYRAVPFEHDMARLYVAADLMLCRSGAMTVAELGAAGVPSVLVPLPGAPGDHQGANARVLADAGAAVVVLDDRCDATTLADTIGPLLDDPRRLADMATSARRTIRPGADDRAAALVEQCASSRGG